MSSRQRVETTSVPWSATDGETFPVAAWAGSRFPPARRASFVFAGRGMSPTDEPAPAGKRSARGDRLA